MEVISEDGQTIVPPERGKKKKKRTRNLTATQQQPVPTTLANRDAEQALSSSSIATVIQPLSVSSMSETPTATSLFKPPTLNTSVNSLDLPLYEEAVKELNEQGDAQSQCPAYLDTVNTSTVASPLDVAISTTQPAAPPLFMPGVRSFKPTRFNFIFVLVICMVCCAILLIIATPVTISILVCKYASNCSKNRSDTVSSSSNTLIG